MEKINKNEKKLLDKSILYLHKSIEKIKNDKPINLDMIISISKHYNIDIIQLLQDIKDEKI